MRPGFRYAALQCNATFSKSISKGFEISGQTRGKVVDLQSSVRIDRSNQVARIGVVELVARALVQHVRVDAVGSQQRDTLLALRALALQPRQFGCQRDDLLIELLPRVQPVLTGIGIDAEIADYRGCHRIEGKPGQQGFESRARDHGSEDATARLMES